jgi:hypothetical protein
MSVHKPKFKNIPIETADYFIKHHLPYELWMMQESPALAIKGAPMVQHNLHVEGFALHARNLIEFLKNGESCGYDPTDFTTSAFSVNRRFIRSALIDMINNQISHLTTNRTHKREEKFDEQDWQETTKAVAEEFTRWSKNLKSEWAKKWEERERFGVSNGGGNYRYLPRRWRLHGSHIDPTEWHDLYTAGSL